MRQVISLEVAGVTDVSLVGSFGFTLTAINKKCAYNFSLLAAAVSKTDLIEYQISVLV